MIVKGGFHKLFKKELHKAFKDAYENIPKEYKLGFIITRQMVEDDLYAQPINKMPKLQFDTNSAVDAEVSPKIQAIDEALEVIRSQVRVLDILRDFIYCYEKNVDNLTITQKRFITRTLNKLHNED